MSVRRSRKAAARKTHSAKRLSAGLIGAGAAALAAVPAANAATFNVTNLNDTGAGSLRQAIVDANGSAGADVVTFQSGLTGTILLTTGQLAISDSVDVQGPGATAITVSGNNSSRVLYLYNGSSTIDVRIAGLTITQGSAALGGGAVNFGENLVLDGVTITANTSVLEGGGLWSSGINMNLTIRNSTLSGNIAGGCGGGIYVDNTGGPLLIDDSAITGNQSSCNGGGIYFYAPADTVTIRDTTISGNSALGAGGGIYLYDTDGGPFTIERSTISGNDASAGGGLAFYGPDDPVVIENSTISGNQAPEAGGGGAYFYALYGGGTLSMNFVTITNNTAGGAGGGFNLSHGSANIGNSIIADNTAGTSNDLGTTADGSFDLSYSLLETNDASVTSIAGNIVGSDPQLGALASNGGPTETQRPALTSPVVNTADPAFAPPPATDQRGQPRVYPTRADMGALELVGGVIQFNPTTYSVAENLPGVTLTVTRDAGPDPASVDFTTNPGTATAGAGNDFTTTAGTLTFAPNDLSETFNVPILDDAALEGNEQFTATLSNPSIDATIGAGNPATVTITDFEPGQLLFASATYNSNETGGSVTLTVNRVNGSSGPASVNFTTNPGTALPGAGNDYTTTSGTLNWADGDAAPKSIIVPILDDTTQEGSENFTVSLNTPSGATVGSPGTSTVTILDDPAGTAQFLVSSINTAEEAGTVTVTVTRTGGTEGPLAVNYATSDGTAVAPSDYTTTSGTITFPAGNATPQSFNIPIINDSLLEGDEMFNANLTGATVGTPSSVTIVIAANDQTPIPAVSFLGKLLLTIFSAVAGFYALMRNRLSAVLFALLILGVAAGPTLSAAPKNTKDPKGSKLRGTLVSMTNDGTTMVLTLSGGLSITLPTKSVNVVDARKAKRQAATLQQVVEGTRVVIKTETDANGVIVKAKIKLTP